MTHAEAINRITGYLRDDESTDKRNQRLRLIRLWRRWENQLTEELASGAAQYGGEDGERNQLIAVQLDRRWQEWLRSPNRRLLLASDCAGCRTAADRRVYPPHMAATDGHVEHCSCGRCW